MHRNTHDEPQGLNYSENGAKNSDSPETYCLRTVNNSGAVQPLIRNFFYLISGHVLKPGLDFGLWIVDYGLWTMDCGLWTVDYRLFLGGTGGDIDINSF